MVVLVGDRAYEVEDGYARGLADAVGEWSRGIGAIERDGVMLLVNEPRTEERVRELEADGWRLYPRR